MASGSEVTINYTIQDKIVAMANILNEGRPVSLIYKSHNDPWIQQILDHFSSFGYRITHHHYSYLIHPPDDD